MFVHTDIRRIFLSVAILLTGSGLTIKGDTRIRMLEELITSLPIVSDCIFFPRLSGLTIHPPIHGSTALCLDLDRFFSFLILYTVGSTPWTGDQPDAIPLPTHTEQHKHRINAHRHPCLERGFEPTIPAFEREKTVHALDRAATVIG
jgi:hypothetical protein